LQWQVVMAMLANGQQRGSNNQPEMAVVMAASGDF